MTRTTTPFRWLLVLCAACTAGLATAETTDETIAALRAELDNLHARLERLEAERRVPEVAYEVPASQSSAKPAATWVDRISWKGDFRYRHESIDAEFAADQRHRQRIRARPALVAEVAETVDVGFGLTTGGDDPVSGNQTLGDAFSSKAVAVDLAYFTWVTPLEGLSWTAGKFKNPLHRTGDNGLLWDSDLRPEGTSLTYRRGGFTGSVIGLWAEESASDDDVFVGGAQAYWRGALGESVTLLLGAGYFDLSAAEGAPVLYDGDPRGNTVNAAGEYVYGYQELELFSELSFDVGDIPTQLFANYVQNLDADEFDTGYAVGGSMEFRHGPRTWSLQYTYQDLEADAVLGIFTDSDFIGGGTDGKGHIFRGDYALTRAVSLGATLFLNERGGNAGVAEDYDRLMLDVEFKY